VLHVPILNYHVIAPLDGVSANTNSLLDILPETFDAMLRTLRREGWRTVTTYAVAGALERGVPLPPRSFVITLDDGHDDGFDYALPILQRYGFVATYYIVTNLLERPTYLTWAEVRVLQGLGMEIGNHTIDHLSLPAQTPAEALRQVAGAQAIFEAHLDAPPTTFAYPYGLQDATAIRAVLATGLKCAVTASGGLDLTWARRFELPRIVIRNDWTAARLMRSINRFR
jgi:peptidoglycan/xylan/chitin deacetylase (PgdA/CDA1 family)